MKKYAVSDLVKEVKVLLDRNQESSGLLTPDDTDTPVSYTHLTLPTSDLV